MVRSAVLVVVAFFAAPLLAQEEIYLYVRQTDAAGETVRYKLECMDARCRVDTKAGKRDISLDDEQKEALRSAVRAEARHFAVAAAPAAADEQTKVKLRYDTPGKRLEIERRLSVQKLSDLTPEMLEVIKAHFDLDLSKTAAPGPGADEAAAPSSAQSDAG